jgi:hypothetical protein
LIALTCGPAPAGYAEWTLRLLEEKVVELQIVERASDNTIGRMLKINILKPHLKQQWVIAPDASAAFVANMEDMLEVYQRPHDPERPVVCLDETSKQMIVETREPVPAKPGRKVRHDYEYERNGVANLFMMFAPLEGWRHVKVTGRHAAIDYAHALKDLSDTRPHGDPLYSAGSESGGCREGLSRARSRPQQQRSGPRQAYSGV